MSAALRPPTWSVRMQAAKCSDPDLDQIRLRGAAFVDGQGAARRERASRLQPDQRRWGAGDGHQPGSLRGVQAGHRPQQPGRVGHLAVPVQVADAGGFDDPSGVHHQRPVGELRDHAQVVGDDQDAGAGDVARGLEHLEDLRLDGDIEGRRRLVADQQIGVVGDGDRDDHPLAFAAGQFVREGAGASLRLGDAHQFEQSDRALAGLLFPDARLVDFDRLGDLVADGVDGGQRGHRVLKHHADRLAAERRHRAVGETEQFGAVQPHRAAHPGVFRQQAHDGHCRNGLARTRLADHGDDFPGVDAVADAPYRGHRLAVGREFDGQVAHLEQRAHRCGPLPGSSASRNPSPVRLAHTRINTSTPAGNRKTQGNVVADWVPLAISVPSETSGGWMPKPR